MNPAKLLAARLLVPSERPKAIAEIADLLAENDGNLVHTAAYMKMQHRTLCRWIETNKDLRNAVEAARGGKKWGK